jgi:hypothetical protein
MVSIWTGNVASFIDLNAAVRALARKRHICARKTDPEKS